MRNSNNKQDYYRMWVGRTLGNRVSRDTAAGDGVNRRDPDDLSGGGSRVVYGSRRRYEAVSSPAVTGAVYDITTVVITLSLLLS